LPSYCTPGKISAERGSVQDMEGNNKIRTDGIVIQAPLASVDAAVMVYLVDQFGDKVRWWRRPPQMDGLIIYTLFDDSGWSRMGYFGEIWLRSIGDQRTNLRATDPDMPSEEETMYYLVGWAYHTDHILHKRSEAENKLDALALGEAMKNCDPLDPGFKECLNTTRPRMLNVGQIRLLQQKLDKQNQLLVHIERRLQRDGLLQAETSATSAAEVIAPARNAQPGNPGLSKEEIIQRMAYAQWAEEIREQDPRMPWKEIKLRIGWPHDVKLLEYARKRLKRYQEADDALLDEVQQVKRELQKKTR